MSGLLQNIANLEARLAALEQAAGMRPRTLERFGMEGERLYYGVYRAYVSRTDDPEKRGRVQLWSPDVGHTAQSYPNVWVDPENDDAGPGRGHFWPPEVGDLVRVAFSNGNMGQPCVYRGGWHTAGGLPTEFAYDTDGSPYARGFITRTGHMLRVIDKPGSEEVRIEWHKPADGQYRSKDNAGVSADGTPLASAARGSGDISSLVFSKDGAIALTNPKGDQILMDTPGKQLKLRDKQNGNTLTMSKDGTETVDKSGNKITTTSSGITLSAAKGAQLVLDDGVHLKDATGDTLELSKGSGTMKATKSVTLDSLQLDASCAKVKWGKIATDKPVSARQMSLLFMSHVHPVASFGPSGPPVIPVTETMIGAATTDMT